MLAIPIKLLFVHFVADFLFQSDWMAINKSKSWKALLAHCAVYAACFLPFGMVFAGITFLTHFITDAITSRITAYLWEKQERHWFFVTIGADQLIHAVTLAASWQLLS